KPDVIHCPLLPVQKNEKPAFRRVAQCPAARDAAGVISSGERFWGTPSPSTSRRQLLPAHDGPFNPGRDNSSNTTRWGRTSPPYAPAPSPFPHSGEGQSAPRERWSSPAPRGRDGAFP